jgi:septal ring factor EnvC (AmiA/AmiB activator)
MRRSLHDRAWADIYEQRIKALKEHNAVLEQDYDALSAKLTEAYAAYDRMTQSAIEKEALIAQLEAEVSDHYREQARILVLEVALRDLLARARAALTPHEST